MHRAAKADANQGEIVQALRQMGASVQHTHQLGQGAPDAICGYKGVNLLIEIKDGGKPPSKRKLTPDEQATAGVASTVTVMLRGLALTSIMSCRWHAAGSQPTPIWCLVVQDVTPARVRQFSKTWMKYCWKLIAATGRRSDD